MSVLPVPTSRSPVPTVSALGEHALIERIRARVPPSPDFVTVGIGDDAAVVEPAPRCRDVITTDCQVEGVHFDRATASPAQIGRKALAVNLSDLAAMGATPRVVVLSLALPDELTVDDFDAIVDGLLALAAETRVALVGGNITRTPGPLTIDIMAIGAVKPRCILTRAGARPGDEIYVSGQIGASAAGLASLQESRRDPLAWRVPACEARHLRPEPRLRLGALLGRTRTARACIDLSDGLADGVRQIARASGVGIIIDADRVPVDPDARLWFERQGQSPLHAALSGGEDYELLFAVPPRHRRRLGALSRLVGDLPITRIGRAVAEPRLALMGEGGVEDLPPGFAHFSGPPEDRP